MGEKSSVKKSDHIVTQSELGIYIHIPFCVRKCAYCDFLSAPADPTVRARYVDELCRQIRSFKFIEAQTRSSIEVPTGNPTEYPTGNPTKDPTEYPTGNPTEYPTGNRRAVSVFLGGGTPSLLEPEQLFRILQTVRETFQMKDPEITVECNPGTLDEKKLKAMKESGVNRLSIGLQSADNEELKRLGRIHTWEEFLENWMAARELGFHNMNIDLISALPGQTVQSWCRTLSKVTALKPEHISAYGLIIEEGTPFYERYHGQEENRLKSERRLPSEDGLQSEKRLPSEERLPSEDEAVAMYEKTKKILEEQGLYRYEISNYAKPGFESIHNSGYWTGREYIGFGLGAASLLNHTRSHCTNDLTAYLAGDFAPKEEQHLTEKDEMEEMMFLGLRMTRGVKKEEFFRRFGTDMEKVYGSVIRKYQEAGLLQADQDGICLTDRGLEVSNMVMASFLLEG